MKQRKTNFTSREVEALLSAVADRKDTVLFGVAGGIGWARAWHEVAQQVSAVEGIHRSESDVRKKWTYLKWEAKNTSKPGRDPTSRAVLDILTSRDRESSQASNSLLEQLLVPQQGQQSGGQGGGGGQAVGGGGGGGGGQQQANPSSPSPLVPIAPKKVVGGGGGGPSTQQQTPVQSQQPPPEVCLRWNSYYSNMQATFPSLLNNEQFVDVTLACEGRSIKCHKVMLSACSSYFEELLSQNPCQHPIVFMRDLKFWEVQALVEFMYSGEVNVAQDRLPSLLAAAEALQIKGLTGPSNSNSSHDEDSLPVPEIDESQYHLQKRPRKRKVPSTPSYHQPSKAQLIGQMTPTTKQQQQVKMPINVAAAHSQVAAGTSGGYVSGGSMGNAAAVAVAQAAHTQTPTNPREHIHHPISLSKIKRETSSPVTVVKQEPLDMSTDYSQGDSDTGQSTEHEMTAVDCSTTITIEPGPIGLTMKGSSQQQQQEQNDNGLSADDEDQTESSNCSEDQHRFTSQHQQQQHSDPGESGGGGGGGVNSGV